MTRRKRKALVLDSAAVVLSVGAAMWVGREAPELLQFAGLVIVVAFVGWRFYERMDGPSL